MFFRSIFFQLFVFVAFSCHSNNNASNKTREQKTAAMDTGSASFLLDNLAKGTAANTTASYQHAQYLYQSDTVKIKGKCYVLGVYKDTAICYFFVLKQGKAQFDTIMVDHDYGTNNSDLFFKDENNDGYLDIVWTKKWQDHAYLFNPNIEEFIEVGEFHDIDTLKRDGEPVLFKNRYPLLYLVNEEKADGWVTQTHSELFIIDKEYNKVSFATLDNFASLEDSNYERGKDKKLLTVNCYVPPYTGLYSKISIWNVGKSVDVLFVKSLKFNRHFIRNYWLTHYSKLLKYGSVFSVRRIHPLINYKS